MQLSGRNLFILLLLVQVALISLAEGLWFGKKDDKKADEKGAAKNGKVAGANEPVAGRAQPRGDEFDADEAREEAEPQHESLVESMNRIRDQKLRQQQQEQQQEQPPAEQPGQKKKRADLDKIREGAAAQQRLEAEQMAKLRRRQGQSDNDKKVQGQGRRSDRRRRREEEEARRQVEDETDELDDDAEGAEDEADEDDDDGKGDEYAASNLLDRLKNDTKMRNHAATKFVSTKPHEEGKAALKKPSLDFLKTAAKVKPGLIDGTIKKNKLITGSFWQKKLGEAYKTTKKGLKEGAKVISEMPKYMEKSIDSINAFLQLDSKGKILALIDEANGDANFVRKEFSQFTLSWSPIMKKALDYLGDEDLDKIKWSDKDELDLKKDALSSLAFGYEFIRLLIIWRENLLVAHEAFKLWLETVKEEVEAKRLELDENVVVQLRTAHTYMMLVTWMTIEEAAHEARTKLDYLMDILDDRPKNYESEYFRNIVVLQELYESTIEELDKERNQVVNSISESGVVVENLSGVDEFFENFRSSLAAHKITGIDWEVPHQLKQFMAKLEPQLRSSSLVYTKAFLKENGLKK